MFILLFFFYSKILIQYFFALFGTLLQEKQITWVYWLPENILAVLEFVCFFVYFGFMKNSLKKKWGSRVSNFKKIR